MRGGVGGEGEEGRVKGEEEGRVMLRDRFGDGDEGVVRLRAWASGLGIIR